MKCAMTNRIVFPLWNRISTVLNPRGIKAGVWAESYGNSHMEFKVFVEEYGGVPIADFEVSVLSPDKRRQPLTYNRKKGIYSTCAAFSVTGEYRMVIEAAGILPFVVRFYHHSLTGTPDILFLIDESGTGTLDGNDLDGGSRILIAWESVQDASMFDGKILKGDEIIYCFNTRNMIFALDKNVLPAHSELSLVLTARRMSGDPVLIKNDFYSGSFSESREIKFQTA